MPSAYGSPIGHSVRATDRVRRRLVVMHGSEDEITAGRRRPYVSSCKSTRPAASILIGTKQPSLYELSASKRLSQTAAYIPSILASGSGRATCGSLAARHWQK